MNDTFFWQPFSAIEMMKDVAFEIIETEDTTGLVGKFENYFRSSVASMEGDDLTCLLLTVQWFDY